MLALAWGGTAVGILPGLGGPRAPRWLYTLLCILLGWTVAFAGDFTTPVRASSSSWPRRRAPRSAASCTACAARNPFPPSSGSRVFHALTVLAFVAHFTGVVVSTAALR